MPCLVTAGGDRARLEATLARVDALTRIVEGLRVDMAGMEQTIKAQRAEIHELRVENQVLREQVKTLTAERDVLVQKLRRVGVTSETSSTPPSTDMPHQRERRTYPTREKVQEKPGRVKGAPGSPVALRDPDTVVTLEPGTCEGCNASFTGTEPVLGVESRQVVDVTVRTHVTQYDARTRKCATCRRKVKATFPSEARSRVCYGPGLRGHVLLMSSLAQLPLRVAAMLTGQVLDVPLPHALVQQWVQQAARDLRTAGFESSLVEELKGSPVVHADETPVSFMGKTVYVHAQVNDQFTYLYPGDRSRDTIKAGGVLDGWEGVLVGDDYVGYGNLLGPNGARQLCWAHLLRDLRWHQENQTGPVQAALTRMVEEVRALIHQAKTELVGSPDQFRVLLEQAVQETRHATGPDVKDLARLLHRLQARDTNLWHFLTGSVPATNNAAEQAVRVEKTRARRSGAYRDMDALRDRLLLYSYHDTHRKQGHDQAQALQHLAAGTPEPVTRVPVPA